MGMKIQTRIYSRKLPESIKNGISLDVIQEKNFKIVMEIPSLVVILCFHQWHIFQKWGVFQRSKGRDHEKFSRGQAPGRSFLLASLELPQYEFRSDGPVMLCIFVLMPLVKSILIFLFITQLSVN